MEPRCYLCGQTGHISKFCSLKRGNKVSPNTTALTQDTNQKVPLTLCPCHQNDYHWRKDCQFHFHRDGTPLPDASDSSAKREPLVLQGNWVRCQLQSHQIAGATQQSQTNDPFLNGGISSNYKEQDLEVQDLICVLPPLKY